MTDYRYVTLNFDITSIPIDDSNSNAVYSTNFVTLLGQAYSRITGTAVQSAELESLKRSMRNVAISSFYGKKFSDLALAIARNYVMVRDRNNFSKPYNSEGRVQEKTYLRDSINNATAGENPLKRIWNAPPVGDDILEKPDIARNEGTITRINEKQYMDILKYGTSSTCIYLPKTSVNLDTQSRVASNAVETQFLWSFNYAVNSGSRGSIFMQTPITQIFQIETTPFYIPIPWDSTTGAPITVIPEKIRMLCNELNQQCVTNYVYTYNNTVPTLIRYHFDYTTTLEGDRILLTPTERVYKFPRIITSLETITLQFSDYDGYLQFYTDSLQGNGVAVAGVVTVITTVPHELQNGDLVTISSAERRINVKNAVVTVVDPNTFTYTITSTLGFSEELVVYVAKRRIVTKIDFLCLEV